ncbi:MAG: GNAT family N-acetyltransferase, partial [Mobilitalea sp.]
MITYKKCTEVSEDKIFEAFEIGFSDYMIQLNMSKDFFMDRFFGAEGNAFEYSFIALDEDKAVGLILGGIKVYEGIKTLRCGALCILPEYRGTQVSKRLFEFHKEVAIEACCKQMFLEVIAGNDRAINFYKKTGYEKVYNMEYYSHNNPAELKGKVLNDLKIEIISMDTLRCFRQELQDIHINWQNDLDYISQVSGYVHYGVFKEERLLGGLSIHSKGKVSFLWIDSKYRHRGIARSLIYHAVSDLG